MLDQLTKPALKNWPLEKLKVLDICQHIHKHAEGFYQYLAEVHQNHREIARMWGVLAVDKCNHSDTFKMANRLKGDGISEIYISADMATKILIKMKTIPKEDRHHPPSVVDALRFAIKMEDKLNSVHFRHVVKFFCEKDMALMTSSLKSNVSIVHMMTEEYVNLTMSE